MGFTLEFCVRFLYPLPLGRFTLKFGQNFHLSEHGETNLCKTHDSAMQTQGQGSWDLPLNFMSSPYLLYLWKDFH